MAGVPGRATPSPTSGPAPSDTSEPATCVGAALADNNLAEMLTLQHRLEPAESLLDHARRVTQAAELSARRARNHQRPVADRRMAREHGRGAATADRSRWTDSASCVPTTSRRRFAGEDGRDPRPRRRRRVGIGNRRRSGRCRRRGPDPVGDACAPAWSGTVARGTTRCSPFRARAGAGHGRARLVHLRGRARRDRLGTDRR